PRQQVGPFLILGIDKDVSREAVEAGWAQKLILARRNQAKTPLEDINWAREMLGDETRRLQSDAASVNVDTTEGTLRQLLQAGQTTAGCKPIDIELDLADHVPTTPLPDVAELRRAITLPELPREVPAAALLLEQIVRQPVDPWDILADNGQTPGAN